MRAGEDASGPAPASVDHLIDQLRSMAAHLRSAIAALPPGGERDRLAEHRAKIDGEIARVERRVMAEG